MNASLWQLAGWTMIHSLWLGAAVALAGGFFRVAARRAAPSARYAISLATLALLAASPIAAATWLGINGVPQLATTNPASASLPLPLGEGWGEGQQQVHAPDRLLPIEQIEPSSELESPQPAVIDLAQATSTELAALAPQAQAAAPAPLLPPSALPLLPSDPQSPITSHLSPLIPHLPTLWLIGAPLTFTLLATGLVGSARLRRRATPLLTGSAFEACERLRQTLKITRRVALAVSDGVAQPILVGVLRPLILLPAAALAGWTPEQLDMVLLHELAHVRRRDNLVNLLQRIIESILFFHPAVWLVSRQVRRDREECCDDAVIRHTNRPEAYATLLIDVAARSRLSGSLSPAQSLAMASAMASHPLAGRIRRILNIEEEPMRITRRTLAATLLLPALLAGAMLYSGANAEDAQNLTPSQEQPSTLANGDRAQGGSEDAGAIQDSDQASETNGEQDNNNLATNELSQALADLEQRKQALLDAEAELAAVESRIAQFTHAELTEKYADIHWKSAPEREILLQQGAAIIAHLRSRTASGASADDAAVQQLQAALAEVRKEDNELRESLKANIWKRAAEDSEFAGKLQNAVRDQEQQQAKSKADRARHEFKASITRLEQLAASDVPPTQENVGSPASPNQSGAASGSPANNTQPTAKTAPASAPSANAAAPRTDVHLPSLQNEIRNLQSLILKAQDDLTNIKVVKELAIQNSQNSAAIDAAIRQEVESDRELNTLNDRILNVDRAIDSGNYAAAKLDEFKQLRKQLESEKESRQSELMKSARERLTHKQDDVIRQTTAEYNIRRQAINDNIAKYQKDLEATRTKLSQLGAVQPAPILQPTIPPTAGRPGSFPTIQEFPASADIQEVNAIADELRAAGRQVSVEQNVDGRKRIVDTTLQGSNSWNAAALASATAANLAIKLFHEKPTGETREFTVAFPSDFPNSDPERERVRQALEAEGYRATVPPPLQTSPLGPYVLQVTVPADFQKKPYWQTLDDGTKVLQLLEDSEVAYPTYASAAATESASAPSLSSNLAANPGADSQEIVVHFPPGFAYSDQECNRILKDLKSQGFEASRTQFKFMEATKSGKIEERVGICLRVSVPKDWQAKPVWETNLDANGTPQAALRLINEPADPAHPLVEPATPPFPYSSSISSPVQAPPQAAESAGALFTKQDLPLTNEGRALNIALDRANERITLERAMRKSNPQRSIETTQAELATDRSLLEVERDLKNLELKTQSQFPEIESPGSRAAIAATKASLQAIGKQLKLERETGSLVSPNAGPIATAGSAAAIQEAAPSAKRASEMTEEELKQQLTDVRRRLENQLDELKKSSGKAIAPTQAEAELAAELQQRVKEWQAAHEARAKERAASGPAPPKEDAEASVSDTPLFDAHPSANLREIVVPFPSGFPDSDEERNRIRQGLEADGFRTIIRKEMTPAGVVRMNPPRHVLCISVPTDWNAKPVWETRINANGQPRTVVRLINEPTSPAHSPVDPAKPAPLHSPYSAAQIQNSKQPAPPAPTEDESPTLSEFLQAFAVQADNPVVTREFHTAADRRSIDLLLHAIGGHPNAQNVELEWRWLDNGQLELTAPEQAHVILRKDLPDDLLLYIQQRFSPFPTLENQKIADRAYKLLKLELDPLAPEELKRVKKLGYTGGLRVTRGNDAAGLLSNDLLVGLHVWPVPDLKSLDQVLQRDDLGELNPLKYYVIRKKVSEFDPAANVGDIVVTGRLSIPEAELLSRGLEQTNQAMSQLAATAPTAGDYSPDANRAAAITPNAAKVFQSDAKPASGFAAISVVQAPVTQRTGLFGGTVTTAYLKVKFDRLPGAFDNADGRTTPQEIERNEMNCLAIVKSPSVLRAALNAVTPKNFALGRIDDVIEKIQKRLSASFPGDGEILELKLEKSGAEGDDILLQAIIDAFIAAMNAPPESHANANAPPTPPTDAAGDLHAYVDSQPQTPPSPTKLKPGDAVILKVAGAFPEAPIDGLFRVEPQGTLPLGPTYGRVAVAGKTVLEAEAAVQAHLGTILTDAKTQLTLGDFPQPAASGAPTFLYDGKTFEQWRDLWKLELNPERRTEAINALAAFSRSGPGHEAADAILEVADEYREPYYGENTPEGKLVTAINAAVTRMPAPLWMPRVLHKLETSEGDAKEFWERQAIQFLRRTQDHRPEAVDLALKFAAGDNVKLLGAVALYLVRHDQQLANPVTIEYVRKALRQPSDDIPHREILMFTGGRGLDQIPEQLDILLDLPEARIDLLARLNHNRDRTHEFVAPFLAAARDPERGDDRIGALRLLKNLAPLMKDHSKQEDRRLIADAATELIVSGPDELLPAALATMVRALPVTPEALPDILLRQGKISAERAAQLKQLDQEKLIAELNAD